LTIEGEGKSWICLCVVEDVVHQVDQAHPEALEGLVPLAVPVRMRYEENRGSSCDPSHAVDRTLGFDVL
jgi:hypothetical protein